MLLNSFWLKNLRVRKDLMGDFKLTGASSLELRRTMLKRHFNNHKTRKKAFLILTNKIFFHPTNSKETCLPFLEN